MNPYVTGSTIRRLRETCGLTQAALAERLGVSDKTVSKWETGKGYPDITLIQPISEALGVSVMELISGETVTNRNRVGNMKRVRFSVCPVCGNVIVAAGEAVVCCHGIPLLPLEPEDPDEAHAIRVERVEDEYYVNLSHPMTKTHTITFLAAVSDDTVRLTRLYPEGNAHARFKIDRTDAIYAYCSHHGLFRIKL